MLWRAKRLQRRLEKRHPSLNWAVSKVSDGFRVAATATINDQKLSRAAIIKSADVEEATTVMVEAFVKDRETKREEELENET